MKNRFFWLMAFALTMITFSFTSCSRDDSDADVENFVNNALDEVCTETRSGDKGCFELIFPVTVIYPDSTTEEVGSYEEMKAAFRTWRENNPEIKGRPVIQFPFSVITEDGTIVEITSKAELKELVSTCKPAGGHGPKGGHGKPCFKINFPVTISTSTGEVTIADAAAFRELLKSLKGSGERPQYVFPISVTLKDGTVQTVATVEELIALKDDCRRN